MSTSSQGGSNPNAQARFPANLQHPGSLPLHNYTEEQVRYTCC